MDDRPDRGIEMRRAVLGGDHEGTDGARTPTLDAGFEARVIGTVRSVVQLSDPNVLRERPMVTRGPHAATGNLDEIAMHLRATRRIGVSPVSIDKTMHHTSRNPGDSRRNIGRDMVAARAVGPR